MALDPMTRFGGVSAWGTVDADPEGSGPGAL